MFERLNVRFDTLLLGWQTTHNGTAASVGACAQRISRTNTKQHDCAASDHLIVDAVPEPQHLRLTGMKVGDARMQVHAQRAASTLVRLSGMHQ